MYLLLILFFLSLFAIIFMIGKKLILQKTLSEKELVLSEEEVLLEIPHLEKVKHFTIKNIKKYEHIGLVAVLRLYVRFSNFLKNKYEEKKTRIKENHANNGEKEISKFLKVIGDYKRKIRVMKHKIHEEEKNL